jgi:hypothetical protein
MRVSVVVFTLLLVCLASTTALGAQRVVLCEDFTNYNCPPCEAIEDTMNFIFKSYIDQGILAPLRYHVWWPDPSDPWWLNNQPDQSAKVTYYGVNYVPTFRYDGTTRIDPSDFGNYPAYYAAVRNYIQTTAASPAPVRIDLTQHRDASTVYVSFDVTCEDTVGIGTQQKVYLVVVEENENHVAGREWYIFKDFVPSGATGEPVSLTLGGTVHYDWTYPTSLAVNVNKLVTYVFVQREGGAAQRRVLNAIRKPVLNPTDVSPIVPLKFQLGQNTPNPFSPRTTIPFNIEQAGDVRLTIFDVSGREVTTLVNGFTPAGPHALHWDGRNTQGNPVSSGVYYYRLESVNNSETRKMTMVR